MNQTKRIKTRKGCDENEIRTIIWNERVLENERNNDFLLIDRNGTRHEQRMPMEMRTSIIFIFWTRCWTVVPLIRVH